MKPTQKVINEADEVRTVTLAEARAMPGLMGRVAAAMLEQRGWYGYKASNRENRKVLLILAD